MECNLSYDEEALDKKVDDISAKLPGAVVQNSYYIEDDELIIVKGTEGLSVKKDELKEHMQRLEEAKKRAAELKELEGKKPKKQPQKSPEKKVSTNEDGRIGGRPYARGRSYVENRYEKDE